MSFLKALCLCALVIGCGKSNDNKVTSVEVDSGLDGAMIVNQLSDSQSQQLCGTVIRIVAPPIKKVSCLTLGYAGGEQVGICQRCVDGYNESKLIDSSCVQSAEIQQFRKSCGASVAQVQACSSALVSATASMANNSKCGDRLADQPSVPLEACDALSAECKNYAGMGLLSQ